MNYPGQASFRQADLIRLKEHLLNLISRELESRPIVATDRRAAIQEIMQQAYDSLRLSLPTTVRDQLFHDIMDDLMGFGPLQPLLDDPEISEVMVNGCKSVYIERNGKIQKTNITFDNDQAVIRVIEKIILPLGRRIDQESPTVDARLPDGSRVNAVIPPVALDGTSITIRKFQKDKLTIDQLIKLGSITRPMADFIRACVISRLNIIISGGTGSGKTTLLNILSGFIPTDERIVTIEDAAELKLQQEHVVRMETKPPNAEGKHQITTRDLVRNSLRMRPDRIIVGEVRGGEALDMLQAMNTGHDGSLSSGHANSVPDMLTRLETMVLMAAPLPTDAIRQQIASAIEISIFMSRMRDKIRKILEISEIGGYDHGEIEINPLCLYRDSKGSGGGTAAGELIRTGNLLQNKGKLRMAGMEET